MRFYNVFTTFLRVTNLLRIGPRVFFVLVFFYLIIYNWKSTNHYEFQSFILVNNSIKLKKVLRRNETRP